MKHRRHNDSRVEIEFENRLLLRRQSVYVICTLDFVDALQILLRDRLFLRDVHNTRQLLA